MVIKFIGKPTLTQIIGFVAICLFLFTNAIQYRTNRGLKTTIKTNAKENKKLVKSRDSVLSINIILKTDKEDALKKADSFKINEKYFKNKYYVTNQKLNTIINHYDGVNTDAKTDLFTDAINN